LLEIRAESYPALTSVIVQLNVSNEGYSVTIIAPTPSISFTPTPEVIEPMSEQPTTPATEGFLGVGTWVGMVVLMGGISSLAYWLLKRSNSTRWAVRKTECIVAGGLLAYTYLAIRMPGSVSFFQESGWLGMVGVILFGTVVGYGIGLSWQRFSNVSKKQPS
jgi:hypothetical protein